MAVRLIRSDIWCICLCGMICGETGRGEILLGNTGMNQCTPSGAIYNPANAPHVRGRFEAELPLMIKKSEFSAKYPQSDKYTKKTSGFSGESFKGLIMGDGGGPGYVYKLNDRYAFSFIGMKIPGPVSIENNDIPIFMLGQMNMADIAIEVSDASFFQFIQGYKLNRNFSLGTIFTKENATVSGKISSSGQGTELASFDGNMDFSSVWGGLRISVLPDVFTLSGAALLYSSTRINLNPYLAMSSESSETTRQALNPVKIDQNGSFRQFRAGWAFKRRILTLFQDFNIDLKPEEKKTFSVSKLKMAEKEYNHRIAVGMGLDGRLSQSRSVLLGWRYVPARIGAGSGNPDGSSGFGSLDQGMIMLGLGDLEPYYQGSIGIEFRFLKAGENENRSQGSAHSDAYSKSAGDQNRFVSDGSSYHKLLVRTGTVYRKGMLEIDKNGEQPGTYQQSTWLFPVNLIMRF
ncbi:MAG: hypothetical protein HQK54_07380 [Oligoflexales bacterium]|nr:hypothetical protein [Oligoflexales bacterium]